MKPNNAPQGAQTEFYTLKELPAALGHLLTDREIGWLLMNDYFPWPQRNGWLGPVWKRKKIDAYRLGLRHSSLHRHKVSVIIGRIVFRR